MTDPDIEEFIARIRGLANENSRLRTQVQEQGEHITRLNQQIFALEAKMKVITEALLESPSERPEQAMALKPERRSRGA